MNKNAEFPPAAMDAEDFRPRADPQPSVTPHCPTSSSNAKGAAFWETFLMPARCRRERRRASQWCSQR